MPIALPPNAMSMATMLVEHFEDGGVFHALPYWDAIGRVWTQGPGFTHINGQPVTPHSPPLTPATAAADLATLLAGTARLILERITVPLEDGQAAALLSLGYNCPEGLLAASPIVTRFNAGKADAAADAMPMFCRSHGVIEGGLQDRRQVERAVSKGMLDPRASDTLGAFHTAVTEARRCGQPVPTPAMVELPIPPIPPTLIPTPATVTATGPAGPIAEADHPAELAKVPATV